MIFQLLAFVAGFFVNRIHSYKGGVVSLEEKLTAEQYCDLIQEIDADIMVFPEFMLVSIPEKLVVGTNPCLLQDKDTPSQNKLSCCTRKKKASYVVLNVMELGDKCEHGHDPHCEFGHRIYNTNFVFDKNGTILTKYRKTHIFPMDQWLFTPGKGIPTTFHTDFGVKFGLFICFDILFDKPGAVLAKEGIKDFVYSVSLHDFLPVTPLQLQQGWSEFYQVNFLASNHGLTGIYSKGTALAWTKSDKKSQYVVAEVPTLTSSPRPISKNENFMPNRPSTGNHSEVFLASPGLEKSVTFNLSTHTCSISFQISSEPISSPQYFLLSAFSEDLDPLIKPYRSTVYYCGLINCGPKPYDCGILSLIRNKKTDVLFSHVTVEMEQKVQMRMVLPLMATDGTQVFDNGQWNVTHHSEVHVVKSTESITQPLLDAGMLGEYDDD